MVLKKKIDYVASSSIDEKRNDFKSMIGLQHIGASLGENHISHANIFENIQLLTHSGLTSSTPSHPPSDSFIGTTCVNPHCTLDFGGLCKLKKTFSQILVLVLFLLKLPKASLHP